MSINASEDGLEPLGEVPAIEPTAFSPVHEVTYYQARCTACGYTETDYGEYSACSDPGSVIDDVIEHSGWFGRYAPTGEHTNIGGRWVPHRELVELLCHGCQHCEVCGTTPAYSVDDEHLVCEAHEDHEFGAAS
ncbi:hypothetical protein SEA_TAPIOCA_53 [Mycobacterium phage Tapioca]|uniref:Uncharacterized protein n=1 Tax=Mycobacterium phage Tapioca TaxID=2301545 RepID=A0A385D4C6_9CAUD|nr:hypothetical protein KD934_gp53 [Mycobacterium phage Tapioca]AXQ53165.1 hypothetical protein SEA_TAPIOCA_53 [Mycobacterium phage Tapioca]